MILERPASHNRLCQHKMSRNIRHNRLCVPAHVVCKILYNPHQLQHISSCSTFAHTTEMISCKLLVQIMHQRKKWSRSQPPCCTPLHALIALKSLSKVQKSGNHLLLFNYQLPRRDKNENGLKWNEFSSLYHAQVNLAFSIRIWLPM